MLQQNDAPPGKKPFRKRFRFLLISLLLLLCVGPFLEENRRISFLIDIFFASILLSAVYAVSERKRNALFHTLLALPMLISLAARYFAKNPVLTLVGNFSGTLFIAVTLVFILAFILKQHEVTREVLYAAIVVYLLMGVMWSFIYAILYRADPMAFSLPDGPVKEGRFLFIYYSFVTLTTVGYGDMTPLTSRACALSVLEAIVGQTYLVVVVAWLVGMYTSQSLEKRTQSPESRKHGKKRSATQG